MYFKRLELHGFKSFAEPVVIEFHRGITCVVGPNGSGKSNICDAIRWVLGTQSAKMLRGDKMEDVIFAGTANRRSRGMAEVTLVIDNSTGILPIEYSEVAITRRMYRSGESEYLINNTLCRMKDIRELIMDTGIGVEGYSIIGQGKIADIISNNTESVREILEETAGIVMYRSKKAEAQRKMKSAKENVERVDDIIGEISGRIDGLREDSIKAEEYLKLKERHRELEINITLKNVDSIELKNEYIRDDIAELEFQMMEHREKEEAIAGNIQKALNQLGDLEERKEEASKKHMDALAQVNELVNHQKLDEARLSSMEEENIRLNCEIDQMAERLKTEEVAKEQLEEALFERSKMLKDAEEELAERAATYDAKAEELALGTRSSEKKKNKLFDIQGEKNALVGEIKSMNNLREALSNRKSTLKDQGNEADADILRSRERLNSVLAELKFQESVRKEKLSELAQLIKCEEKALGLEKSMVTEMAEKREEASRLIARKKTFEEMESNYEGYNSAVKFIMKEKQKGIRGVVAELIKVPRGFETAVETALGATIQNIVCDDDKTGKTGIRRLKESKAGRLTFLPISGIRPGNMTKSRIIEEAKGFCGYGVDCVEYHKEYRSVIEYLLGNVVVMDNIDQAVSLLQKMNTRHKLVTLDGEIINASGAMTGGRYKNKSANILERRTEILQLGEDVATLNLEIENLEKDLEELRRSGKARNREKEVIKEALRDSERFINEKEKEMALKEAAILDLEVYEKRRHRELSQIEEEQTKSQETVSRLQLRLDNLTDEMKTLEKDVVKEYEVQKSIENLVLDLREEVTESRLKVNSCRGEKEKLNAVGNKVRETIQRMRISIEDKKVGIERLELERQQILKEHCERAAILKERERRRNHMVEFLKELTDERVEYTKVFEEENKIKEELNHKMEGLQHNKYELEIKQARQETQLENAKAKLWEEFELSYIQAMEFKSDDFVLNTAVKENREIKNKMRDLGDVNIGAIAEYATVHKRYAFLSDQRKDIVNSMEELIGIIRGMDKTIRCRFKQSFDMVVENFESVFQELYGGGHARIFLSDETDPFNSDIEITAQPPGKQLKHINLLSGGEKTMTAIALMFAVLKTKPTPCCILDEVEAALDDSNLKIFGRYLRTFKGVQFTLITHQKTTMEHADVMYGITMPESGISKVYSLKMETEERA